MNFLKSLVLVLLGILIGIGAVGVGQLVLAPDDHPGITLLPTNTPSPIVVYISGEVRKSGVYAVPEGSRVIDVVKLAGGFKDTADPTSLDLAALVRDGVKIRVPTADEILTTDDFPELVISGDGLANDNDPQSTNIIDLNTATKSELESLPGIGPTLAQRILDYRDEYGDFIDVEELAEVPGISETLMNNLAAYVTVSD